MEGRGDSGAPYKPIAAGARSNAPSTTDRPRDAQPGAGVSLHPRLAVFSKVLALLAFFVGLTLLVVWLTLLAERLFDVLGSAPVLGLLLLAVAALFARPWWFNPFVFLDWTKPLSRHERAPSVEQAPAREAGRDKRRATAKAG